MAANRDEAAKCIQVSQRHLNAGNLPSARRFAEKSRSLYPSPEVERLLELIAQRESEPSSQMNGDASSQQGASTSASASGAETHPTRESTHKRHPAANGSAKPKPPPPEEKKREYTPEQAAVVKRIQKCKVTDYYEIMALQKDCEEADVKRAYRKLALQLHPDKNGAPGADEAFKLVSKAFQVLSDSQKRAIYDQHGSDPDSRFSGRSTSSPFGPAGAGGFGGDELSPEDLFNMFFGGGGPAGFRGAGFGGGGPMFTATFGQGGWQTHQMGGARGGIPRQRQQQAGQQGQAGRNNWLQLLPFLFIFVLPLLSNIFSALFSEPPIPDPAYSFTETQQFSSLRLTSPHKVPYYVHLPTFTKHSIYESIPTQLREDSQAGRRMSSRSPLSVFEARIEDRFATAYYDQCQREHQRKEQEIDRERGFFGLGADYDKIKKLEQRKLESCEILRQYGFIS